MLAGVGRTSTGGAGAAAAIAGRTTIAAIAAIAAFAGIAEIAAIAAGAARTARATRAARSGIVRRWVSAIMTVSKEQVAGPAGRREVSQTATAARRPVRPLRSGRGA